MATIGFIGLGNMGLPMAQNLIKAGHTRCSGSDVSKAQMDAAGRRRAAVLRQASRRAAARRRRRHHDAAGRAARERRSISAPTVFLSHAKPRHAADRFLDHRRRDRARCRGRRREAKGLSMLDAPVSGGVGGAQAGTLTFMVGGSDEAFERAKPILEEMGKTIVHAGGAGNGQAAKICNNMILGISMIAVSEAFVLAEKLGLDAQKLFDISSKSSGQCWSMTSYCPVPGPVPTSPANRDYQAGLHRRDDAEGPASSRRTRRKARARKPRSARAPQASTRNMSTAARARRDFSGIFRFIRGEYEILRPR